MKQMRKPTELLASKVTSCNISSEKLRTNYHNIKFVLTICLVSFFTFSCEKTTSQPLTREEIQLKRNFIAEKIKELYSQRTNQPDTLFRLNPEINEVTEILSSKKVLNHTREHKDVIRELLNMKFIYDYQVHYFAVHLENLDSRTIERHLKKHESLLNAIDQPNAFRMGIAIEAINNEYSLHLLITEYYLDIIPYVETIENIFSGGTTYRTDIIRGKSFIENLYYNTSNQKATENLESLLAERKKIELHQDNRFTLAVSGGLQNKNLFFIDETGKVLANWNFLLYKKNEK